MRPHVLKAKHFIRQIFDGKASLISLLEFLADLIILAKHTTQIAAGEENRAGAAYSGYRRLFAKMQPGRGQKNIGVSAAHALLANQSIDAAAARATFARRELV